MTLSLHSPDGDQGYPGNIDVEPEFTLQDSTLVLRHRAVSDADTLTSHGYFNLAGHNSGSAMDQHILLFAHAYTPSNAEGIPLGVTQSVDHPGKGGYIYGPRHGFCLETQFYPDAIHRESVPSPILEAGKVYNHSTVFSFNNI